MGAAASIGEKKMDELSTSDICQIFASLELPQYIPLAEQRNVDGKELAWISTELEAMTYLQTIGITDDAHRHIIVQALIKLNPNIKPTKNIMCLGSMVNMHSPTLTVEQLATEVKDKPERIEENGEIIGFGEGCTPLMAACYFGKMDIISILLDAGADANAKSSHVSGYLVVKLLTLPSGREHKPDVRRALW
jgi:hypothetical protein